MCVCSPPVTSRYLFVPLILCFVPESACVLCVKQIVDARHGNQMAVCLDMFEDPSCGGSGRGVWSGHVRVFKARTNTSTLMINSSWQMAGAAHVGPDDEGHKDPHRYLPEDTRPSGGATGQVPVRRPGALPPSRRTRGTTAVPERWEGACPLP